MTKGSMDKKLRLVQHLFGESANPEELEELLQDSDLMNEYAELCDVQRLLDSGAARGRPKAPEAAINRIVAAAGPKIRPFGHRPVRRVRRVAMWGGISAAAAALLLILIWPQSVSESPSESGVVEIRPPMPLTDSELSWDDTQDYIELRQSLRVVRERTSPQLWDESAVMNLDSIPASASDLLQGLGVVSASPRN